MEHSQRYNRLQREIRNAESNPTDGIFFAQVEGSLDVLEARITGLEKTPYESGVFKLNIRIPEMYPFQPPHIRFVTPVYHPNIDRLGYVCLDLLKVPPMGMWSPTLTITGILQAIRLLLAQPNPDDPLEMDIAELMQRNKELYLKTAREWTSRYACRESGVHPGDESMDRSGPSAIVNQIDMSSASTCVIQMDESGPSRIVPQTEESTDP